VGHPVFEELKVRFRRLYKEGDSEIRAP